MIVVRMVRRRKKIKIRRYWILPLTLILGLSVFVAATVLYRPPQNTPPQKPPATEYFEIITPTIGNIPPKSVENGSGLILYDIIFTIKAVKDAHEITVHSWAGSEPWDVGDLQQGQYKYAALTSPNGYFTTKEEQGYPVTIDVTSIEAEGEITFYI